MSKYIYSDMNKRDKHTRKFKKLVKPKKRRPGYNPSGMDLGTLGSEEITAMLAGMR